MPVTSSGRIVKTRKGKKGTSHQKNHRWESFTSKVSKLNSLDPIRRVRRHDLDAGDDEKTGTEFSYFRTGLEKWQELNLSSGFISFTEEVLPLCDNLAQVLYFEEKIMALMVTYIEKRERESLEPLLELITDFAHDLGTRFEKHYGKALEMVTAIAGTPQDVAVIEWSFTCLAFMFKYLSKLLVPDLRPTYDLLAPLLGKKKQPPHIARFAAEAMSYLIRKAGAPAHREIALPLIVKHAKFDLESIIGTKEFGLYYHGLMTLFAEAMKGNGMTIHTSGPAVFQSLLDAVEVKDLGDSNPTAWVDVVCGVLTSIVHHTRSDTFKPALEVVLREVSSSLESFAESTTLPGLQRLVLSARLIGVIAGVRKGVRIEDWPAVLRAMSALAKAISKSPQVVEKNKKCLNLVNSVIMTVSITMQYSPMDAMIPFISPFMESLTKDPLAEWFFVFCSYLSEADTERFQSIALPYFQRFVIAHWSEDNGDALCVLLPKMVSTGVLPSNYGKEGFTLPQSWQDQIVSKFERLEVSPFPEQASPAIHDRSPTTWHDRCLPKYNALLEVLECTSVHPSTNARIAEILHRKLKLALRPSSSLAPEEANFIVGRGFSAYSRMVRGTGEADKTLKPLLRAAAPRYARLPNFLSALLEYEKSLKLSPQPNPVSTKNPEEEIETDLLLASLISNLSTSSHELRLLSLRLLEHIHDISSESLSVMIMVEQTPLDMNNSRSASMYIRKLATLYPGLASDSWLKEAIPAFCFGMLTVKFAQIWEDATASLKLIAGSKAGEEAVAKLAFSWLEVPSMVWDGRPKNAEQSQNNGLTDFECSNMLKFDQLIINASSQVEKCRDSMLQNFADAQELVVAKPSTARTQALRVLAAAPGIAEKRSRQFVPMFFSWASKSGIEFENTEDDDDTISDWTRKDQKSQLDIFQHFVNSVSLFKADQVYNVLLQLLANGDIEIQKSALKAIFTWNIKSIKPYEENLLNLLDEARFKDEIGVVLQGDTVVQPEHRPVLKPVLLRVLYGRSIARKGAASGRQGMEAKRLTVLRNLGPDNIEAYLGIALGEIGDVKVVESNTVQDSVLSKELSSPRKLVGVTHMIEGVLKELGTKIAPFAHILVDPVLYCTIHVSRQLANDVDDLEETTNQSSQTSLLKAVRQTGLKCLILLFVNAGDFDWSPYVNLINQDVISPRLGNLPIETAQGISGVLRLLYTWSTSPNLVLYLGLNPQVLPKISECLIPETSKDEVKLFALSIIKNVVDHAHDADKEIDIKRAGDVRDQLLAPYMDHFLIQIGKVLRGHHDISKDVLESCVVTVSKLSPFVTTSTQAHNLVDVAVFLLDQPLRRVSPKTKGELLKVLETFVPLYDLQHDPTLKDKVYKTITSLFGFFTDNPSREILSRVLVVFSQNEPVLKDVASICMDLNSFDTSRLDAPDFDRRLKGFKEIRSVRDQTFTARQWTPLLFNMLFYIKDTEDLGILSSNSSDGICSFIDAASKAQHESEKAAFLTMFSSILIPAIFSGVREQSEVVRREYCKVMAHLIRKFPTWSEVSDMHGLLAGEDEVESSFFNNILTVGKGRQSSALGQVAAAAERGELQAKNVSQFFIPLIEHFIFDRAEGNDAHNLAAEATTVVGNLAGSLEWPQYRALLRRYIGYVSGKQDLEKQIIRLVGKIIDALAASAELQVKDTDIDAKEFVPATPNTLFKTMPKHGKLSDDLTTNIIPPLTTYLHGKDESTVSLRVPVAIIVVRLLKLLPQEQLNAHLPAVLTDICHILRSKAQESRDMTRDTLTKIAVLLGPSCFGFILKELRGALARGSQLHVLSYTLHSMLVATTPEYAPGDLDYCLPSIVAIIMDDIFGATGQEKDAEEYASKMKEVKSSKSHDSMELIAKTSTLTRLTDLVRPIQVLLKEKLNIRMVRKIDELLNRINNGILRNPAANSRDSLTFCYEVIQDVYKNAKPEEKKKQDYRLKRYLIQKGAKKSGERGTTTVYTYKLLRFAFDVMRSVLKKHDNLRTAQNTAAFLPIIGDAVIEAEEEVRMGAFRLLATMIKIYKVEADGIIVKITNDQRLVKVSQDTATTWTNLYRVAAAEAVRSISGSTTTTSEISQASLKLISVVLRDRPDVPIKPTSVDDLLVRVKDDLTEPEHRHVTFKFLRSVLDAKVQTAIVYDTLDYVGTVMVTNYDSDTRDLARGAYFQFLGKYPQQKNRWKKQLEFIVANLKYEREGGRSSILDVIHLLLTKSADEYVQEVSAKCFVPLIFVLANDESEKCRKEAGEVLKEIFKRANGERINTFLTLLKSWIKQAGNPSVVRLGLQVYGFYYESHTDDDSDIHALHESIISILNSSEEADSDWEQIYAALQLTIILVKAFPEKILSSESKDLWIAIRKCLSYPHAWVKLSATLLTSRYFADFGQVARLNVQEIGNLPMKGSGGLKLAADDITDFIRRSVHIFRTPGLTSQLASEAVKNLGFLGLIAGKNDIKWRGKLVEDEEDDDVDAEDEKEKKTVLQFLFGRLSYILRRETSPPRAPALVPKTASLQLIELLGSQLLPENLLPCLEIILLPLHNLTDPSIPTPYSTDEDFKTGYEELKTKADGIMEVLKRKIGTDDYSKVLLQVIKGVKERRMQRSGKRKVEAVSAPERFGETKRKKVERKKERRKEKGREFAARRREV